MNQTPTKDLVTLSEELRRIDLVTVLDLNLAMRKAGRELRQLRAKRGWKTRRGR